MRWRWTCLLTRVDVCVQGRYMKDPPNIDILELELEQSNNSDFYSGEYKGKLMEVI